jgi:hypothetical protein
MKHLRICVWAHILLALVAVSPRAVRADAADPVIRWNLITKTAIVDNAGKPPTSGAVIQAYVHGAVYDAVNAIEGQYTPYAWAPAALDPTASTEAAVASAAYHVLVSVFPLQSAYLGGQYAGSLASIPDGDAKDGGIAIGVAAAEAMLAFRAGDGFEAPIAYTPGSGPGAWQPTPPAFLPALSPWMAQLRPFTLTSPAQFRADGPPLLKSRQWAEDYDEVKVYGAAIGSLRTPEQTELARFWTENPTAQYSRIWRDLATARGLTLSENARFFAMLSMGWADSLLACWDSKFFYSFWRPVTAIRAGHTDGNAATAPDPGWSPLVGTPNHPEYPAAHSASAGAISKLIEEFFGTKQVEIVLSSAVTGTSHTVGSTDDFAKELIEARIYGGIHYRTSGQHGVVMGRKIARWLSRHFFEPVQP